MVITEVVAALIRDGDRFLVCQRPAHKARGLLWEFPGGKVEPGESREQALVRECGEELAIELAVGELFTEVVHQYPDLTLRLSFFLATIAEGTPSLLEHTALRWVTPQQMDQLELCPADRGILEALKRRF